MKSTRYYKGDFFIIPNKEQLQALKTIPQVVFMWLCIHADDNGCSWPSRKTLAKEAGISVRTLDSALETLCAAGFIVKESRARQNNSTTSNHYQIVLLFTNSVGGEQETTLGGAGAAPPELEPMNKEAKASDVDFQKIFWDFLAILNQPNAKLLPSRLAKLKARLKTWTPEQLKAGARGAMNDPFMTGENDNHKKYATIDYILANDVNVEKRMGMAAMPKKEVIF